MKSIGWAVLDKDNDLWGLGLGYNKKRAELRGLKLSEAIDTKRHAPFKAVEVFIKEGQHD